MPSSSSVYFLYCCFLAFHPHLIHTILSLYLSFFSFIHVSLPSSALHHFLLFCTFTVAFFFFSPFLIRRFSAERPRFADHLDLFKTLPKPFYTASSSHCLRIFKPSFGLAKTSSSVPLRLGKDPSRLKQTC